MIESRTHPNEHNVVRVGDWTVNLPLLYLLILFGVRC
jgi:hypothetical protein